MGDGPEDDRERLIDLAVYDFHAAADRGASPDPAAYVALHPGLAPELGEYFDDLGRLGPRLSPPTGRASPGDPAAADGPEADDALGDYVLLEKLGEGGQGVVWKARPRHEPEIVVALKCLKGSATGDAGSVDRLRRDARAIARMTHPNIVRTYFSGEDHGRWFFTMELVGGGTAADRVGSYKADPRSAAALMEKVARAIHHAHTRNPGVLHLDLKPGNILLTAEGEPKVTDFGLSARAGESDRTGPPPDGRDDANAQGEVSATLTRAGIRGTYPYMSPEMAGGRWSEVSAASDLYGLGAVLYALITGRPPFRGRDAEETRALVVGGELESPRRINPEVDRELDAVCLRCLDRDPERRYGSADALANDLRRWLDREPTLAGGRPGVARHLRFWIGRHPARVAFLMVAVLASWSAGLAVSFNGLRAENRREAGRLAGQVDRELRLIRRAAQILARDPRLRAAFASTPGRPVPRQLAIESFLKDAIEGDNLFGIAGGNPLVNVFVLEPDGVLRADTLPDSPSVGRSFRARDYYRAWVEGARPRDAVYTARSFRSVTDSRYKIAVSIGIRGDRDEFLGVLVANFTIGPRLIDLDLRPERADVAVLCPMDRSDPTRGEGDRRASSLYLAVLDRKYTGGPADRPVVVESARLPDFQRDSTPDHVAGGPSGGVIVDYHRVGRTHLVVAMRRRCPWPLSWLPEIR